MFCLLLLILYQGCQMVHLDTRNSILNMFAASIATFRASVADSIKL
jgi:hypothetical protein